MSGMRNCTKRTGQLGTLGQSTLGPAREMKASTSSQTFLHRMLGITEVQKSGLCLKANLRGGIQEKAVVRCPEPVENVAIDMKNLGFSNRLVISRFFIPRIVRFNGSTFRRRLVAQTVVFLGLASFAKCQFGAIVTFQNAKFHQTLDFSKSDFKMGLNLQSSRCVDLILFESRFKDALVLVDVSCNGIANLSAIKPLNGAEWSLAGFQFSAKGATYFNGTVVNGDVDFRQADFGRVFSAAQLSVSGQLEFSRARFASEAYFGRSKLNSSVSFFQTTFLGRAYFDGIFFGASAPNTLSFQDCSFKEPATFHGAQFAKLYPYFGGAILHDKTAFTDHLDNWPKGSQAEPGQAKACCAVIRHSLGRQGLPEAEHFFFRREMGFAGRIGPWWQRLPYRAFGWVSDYGHSILTPFMWLFLLIVGGGYAMAYGLAGSALAVTFEQGLGLSFANVFNFLAFHKTFATEEFMACLPPGLKAFSGFQAIAGVLLLFFLGLGLRTRFRMR